MKQPKYLFKDGVLVRPHVEANGESDRTVPRHLPVVRHEWEGVPSAGRIHFLRQVHLRTSDVVPEPDLVEQIAEVQTAILRELVRQRFKVIIVEDQTDTLLPDDGTRSDLLSRRLRTKEIHRYFDRDSLLVNFSWDQKRIVAQGAGELYAALFDDVILQRSCSPSEMEENLRLGDIYRNDPATMMRLSMEWRDRWVIREACAALDTYSLSDVAVIFGAHHEFTKGDLPEEYAGKCPSLVSYHWPRLGRRQMDLELEMRDCKDPMLQEQLVEEAQGLTEWSFGSILTERGRQRALPKLYRWNPPPGTPGRNETAEQVLQCLLRSSAVPLTHEMRDTIELLYRNREGIFSEFAGATGSEQNAIKSSKQLYTRESLNSFFRELGVKFGDTLLVHSSLSRLGWVCGGPVAVIQALLDVLGPDGTLMVPTHTAGNTDPSHWRRPPVPEEWWCEIRRTMPAFDPERTPSRAMGAIPELLRTWPGALRSKHPIGSFAALGKHAQFLTENHELEAEFGDASPLGNLYQLDGLVLLLGVSHSRNTSLHLAEWRARYPSKAFKAEGTAMLRNGERAWVEFQMQELETDDFEEIGLAIERETDSMVGCSEQPPAKLFRQRSMVDKAVTWMETYRK